MNTIGIREVKAFDAPASGLQSAMQTLPALLDKLLISWSDRRI